VLTFVEAWSNEVPGTERAFAFWFVVQEQSGNWWWMLALIGAKQLGLTEIRIRRISSPKTVHDQVRADDEPTSWARCDPVSSVERVREEFLRAANAPWATEYREQFEVVAAEFKRWEDATHGASPVVSYDRGS
jgi:hypothetical protein